MNPNYKLEEVKNGKTSAKDILLPIFLAVSTFIGIMIISVISFTFGFNQGKLQATPKIVSTPSLEITSTPTPTPLPTATINKNSSPTPSPIPKTEIITAIKSLDGFVSSNGYSAANSEIRVGRNKFLTSRGFLSFPLEKLPANAKIISATLRIYQVKTVGNPYSSETGYIKIDHLVYGDTLDPSDYDTQAISSQFDDLSKNRLIGWKEVDVTNRVIEDVGSKREFSQFRIRFENEQKGQTDSGDYAYFESSDNSEGTSNIPQILIKYY